MNYQKYTNIIIPENNKIEQIFIAKNTFDYGMILKENETFKIYKNSVRIGKNIDGYNGISGIISDNGNIISNLWRKQNLEMESIKAISVNGNIPENEYIFFGFPQYFKRTKNGDYLFSKGQKLNEGIEYITRNGEIIFDTKDMKYWTYNELGNFIIQKNNDNNIYLNGNIVLFNIPDGGELIHFKLFDNLDWNLVYEKEDIFYVITNGKELNKIKLLEGLIFEKFIHLNNDASKLFFSVIKNNEYGISINGNIPFLTFENKQYEDDFIISDDFEDIIYKGYNINKKHYYLIKSDNIICEFNDLVSQNNVFDISKIKGFEKSDILISLNLIESNKYFYNYNILKEKIEKDFDKVESLVIGDDRIFKFIGYLGNSIGLYYFLK